MDALARVRENFAKDFHLALPVLSVVNLDQFVVLVVNFIVFVAFGASSVRV